MLRARSPTRSKSPKRCPSDELAVKVVQKVISDRSMHEKYLMDKLGKKNDEVTRETREMHRSHLQNMEDQFRRISETGEIAEKQRKEALELVMALFDLSAYLNEGNRRGMRDQQTTIERLEHQIVFGH